MHRIRASEKTLEPRFCAIIERAGGMARKLVAISFTGWPDRTILLPGGVVAFVEFKSTGKKLRARQEIVKAWLIKNGFRYYVVDTEESLQAALLELIKGNYILIYPCL